MVAPHTRRAHVQPPSDRRSSSTYAQRLRAHSKRAWNMFNDLMAVGELDRYYGPVLAAHVYLTRGHASHTISQRAVAEHTGLPVDRVKDQMQRLEALGMLHHRREGNRWRTTLLPFVSLGDAVRTLGGARGWSEGQTAAYLGALAERGVRLPWALSSANATDDTVPAPSDGGDDTTLVQQLADAIAAFGRGDFQAVQAHLDHAVHALAGITREGAFPGANASADHSMPSDPPSADVQTARITSPMNDPEISPAITPAITPKRSRKPAPQHADRVSLIENQNPNRRSESHRPVTHTGGRAGSQPTNHDTVAEAATLQLLMAEGIYPANIQRFATLPYVVVQAASAAANVPRGHPHRPGRIVERLEAYTNGLWRPLEDSLATCATLGAAGNGNHREAPLPLCHSSSDEPDGHTAPEVAATEAVWIGLLDDLRGMVEAAEFDTWLSSATLVDISDDTVVVAAANVFARDQIAQSYGGLIEQLLNERVGRALRATFVIG